MIAAGVGFRWSLALALAFLLQELFRENLVVLIKACLPVSSF
jgi:hypothetical protein